MKRFFRLSVMGCGLLALASCSIYHPQTVDIPLLEAPGETRVDAAIGVSTFIMVPTAVTLGATASHAFNGWLGGQVHANYGGDNYYLQAAPGAYWAPAKSFRLEGYAGVGFGGSRGDQTPSSAAQDTAASGGHEWSGQFVVPFLQMNVGWRNVGPFEFAFGVKVGALMPHYTYTSYSDAERQTVSGEEHYSTTNALIEPQLQLRVGSDRVKYTLRVSMVGLSDLDNSSSKFIYSHLTLSNGLVFSF